LLPSALAGGFFMENNQAAIKKLQVASNDANKLAKINSIGLYVPWSIWEFPIDLDILESLTTDFSRNSRVAGLLNCGIEGPIGGITTYHFCELGTIQIRKKRRGLSEIYIKRFSGLYWDKDLLTHKNELQDAIFNDYIELVRSEMEESSKTVDEPKPTDKQQVRHSQLGVLDGKEKKQDIEILELWCAGFSGGEISIKVVQEIGTIYNIISKLRKKYPEAKIPYDRERKLMRY
jgi:hypothetical protein